MARDMRGGFLVNWSRTGQGARDALLLHCSLAHQGAWSGVREALGAQFRCTAFNMPGHGQSAPWDGRGDFQDSVCAIARDLLEPPVDLIGHSFGATVALRLAVETPDLVRSLVLIEPVCLALLKGDAAYDAALGQQHELVALLDAGEHEKAAGEFSDIWGTGQPWADLSAEQRAHLTAGIALIPATESAVYEDRANILAKGRLENLRLPALLLSGSKSPAVIKAVQSQLQERLPNATSHTIAGARHMVAITHPRETAAAISAFHDDAG